MSYTEFVLFFTFVCLIVAIAVARHLHAQLRVLKFLREGGEWYGAEVAEHCRIGRGTIYVILASLETQGWIRSRNEPAQGEDWMLPRRLYQFCEARK